MQYKFYRVKTIDHTIYNLFNQVKNNLLTDYDKPTTYLWELLKDSKGEFNKIYLDTKFIGVVYATDINIHSLEYGGFAYRHNGKHTVEASKQYIDILFRRYKVVKIKATTDSTNKTAKIALNRIGFIKESILKNETKRNGELIDRDVYAIYKHYI